MILKKDFPILEFDPAPRDKIEPSEVIKKLDVPEYCVITFFGDVIKKMLSEGRLKKVGEFITCTVVLPVYETEFDGRPIGIVQGYLGAAGSGLKKLISCYKRLIKQSITRE